MQPDRKQKHNMSEQKLRIPKRRRKHIISKREQMAFPETCHSAKVAYHIQKQVISKRTGIISEYHLLEHSRLGRQRLNYLLTTNEILLDAF